MSLVISVSSVKSEGGLWSQDVGRGCRVDEQEEGMGEAPLGAGRGFCKEPREKFQAGFNAPRSPAELTSGRSAAEQQIRPGRRLCVAQSG